MFYRYTIDKPDNVEEIVNGLKKYNTINILNKEISNNDYITINHFKTKNILDGYTLDDNNSNSIIYK